MARKPKTGPVLRFRSFERRHLPQVARLNAEAGFNFDIESEAKKYFDESFFPEQIVLGLSRGEVVGKMDLVEGVSSRGRFLLVSRLVVAEAHRGKGLGGEFLRHAVAEARRRGCATVDLYVSAKNPRAIALYAANGFTQKDVDIHMQKRLGKPRRRP